MADTRRLATSTAAFGVATAISRVAGLVRESVAAAVLGSGAVYSAFTVAFNLPNLVRAIVADNAISAAFVPVFLELREQGEEQEAWRVAGMVLWTTAVLLGALSALMMLLAPLFVPLLLVGTDHVAYRPGRHAHPHPVPDRGADGPDRRGHRHPQLAADLRRAGVRAGGLEPGDHRLAAAVRAQRARSSTGPRSTPSAS